MPSFSQIDWLSTFKVTFARGLASTVVLAIATAAGYLKFERELLYAWPFLAVFVVTIAHFITKGVGYVLSIGINDALLKLTIATALFFFSLLIACGDPIVYIVNRLAPRLLNITNFKLFNFVPLLIVYKQPSF